MAALANALHTLDADGLTPQDYRPDTLVAAHRQALEATSPPEARVRFELRASQTLLTALRHLQRGKVDPYRIDPDWEVPIAAPPLDLAEISQSVDTRAFDRAFAAARPSAPPYQRLRASLARYRHIARQGAGR